MMINLPMLKRGLHRLIARRYVEITTLAAKRWIVCDGEDSEIHPAIRLPGEMDKVVGLCNWRNWPTETLLLDGGMIHHCPTEAFLLRNVRLVKSFLYLGPAKLQPGYGAEDVLLRCLPPKRHIRTATLMTNNTGSHFFGNFLWDDMPLALLEEDISKHLGMVKKEYVHEAGYRELLGVPKPPVVENACIDELVIFEDFAQNSSKAARLRLLRARLRDSLSGEPATSEQPCVYIRRGTTGERRVMENEPEVEAYLEKQGFTIIDPTVLSPKQIALKSRDAKLVVGIEGSHMAHALYSIADRGTLLILQPPARFCLVHKEFTDRLDMRYAFLVGDQSENGFRVSIDRLQRTLDMLQV